MKNILLSSDSYKVTQYSQMKKDTQNIYSYFESRGGKWNDVVFFGLQYLLKEYLQGEVIQQWMINEADGIFALHFGNDKIFNRKGWEYILNKYNGKLPVSIKAVPEGSVIPNHNVLVTIENTDPNCYWLTNYLETLLVQLWYPCVVATQSREMKKILYRYLEETGDVSLIDFKLHSFGSRGCSSMETVGIGGLAHLVNFKGTDDLNALQYGRQYYHENMAGFSIVASEHSTITSWGKSHEVDAYRNILDQFPTGTIACVSDSYDIYNACENLWGGELRDKILNREGVLVVRPDSGPPHEVLPRILDILGKRFGYIVNVKGYKVLDPHVRVIQGDGIEFSTLEPILEVLKNRGWSTDNIAFGSGGGLLQKLNRDTLKFAFKCSSTTINGVLHDVYKDPITDSGKQSKRGRLKLIKENNSYKTVNQSEPGRDELVEVFRNGKILKEYSFEEIRRKAELTELKNRV